VRRWQLVPPARIQSVRVTQGIVSRKLRLADLEFHTAGGQIGPHASGLDAAHVLERQAELLQLVHHPAAIDPAEPLPSADPQPVPEDEPGPQDAGQDARRADQADETISSTE
jgi:putative membrane protein